jgi:hypothetical protein
MARVSYVSVCCSFVQQQQIPLRRALARAQLFKSADRAFAARAVVAETGMHTTEFDELKRGVKLAAWRGGVPAMLGAGWAPPEGLAGERSGGEASTSGQAVPEDLWVGACQPAALRRNFCAPDVCS